MKKNICILLILISYVSCSNGQSKEKSDDKIDYAKEIIGCWKMVDKKFNLESNYLEIDSLVGIMKDPFTRGEIKNPYTIKFSPDFGEYFEDNKPEGFSKFKYKIEEDLIYMDNSDYEYFNITLKDDTLALICNSYNLYDRIMDDLKWEYNIDIPQDINTKKLIRIITLVRVQDCDQYKE